MIDYLDSNGHEESNYKEETHRQKVRITVESYRHRDVANLTLYGPASQSQRSHESRRRHTYSIVTTMRYK